MENDIKVSPSHELLEELSSTHIAFLLRKLARIALANFASVTCPLNSLSLPRLLIKWSSPVVQKQHFEVVFVPPAPTLSCRQFNSCRY